MIRRGLAAAAVVSAASASAAAQEVAVFVDAPPEDPFARRIAQELQALGHAIVPRAMPGAVALRVRATPRGAVVGVEVAARPPQRLDVPFDDDASRDVAALRVVEAVRAALLALPQPAVPPPAPPPPADPPRGEGWEALRASLAAGASVSAGGLSTSPVLHLRLAWEGPVWAEIVGDVALAAASAGEASLRASTLALGVGAPLIRGPRGALGVSLRGGLAFVEARGDAGSGEGVVGVISAALTGRVQLWRRLGVYASLAAGSALAPVRLRAASTVTGEWGRPFLIAALGVSF
jgi:hypothetical protein